MRARPEIGVPHAPPQNAVLPPPPGSGEEALQVVAAFNPQLVLLDIGLPGINGYEVARRLKAAAPEQHVIALSGYGQLEDRQHSAAAGFDGHLVKPVDLAALKHALALASRG